MKTSNTGRERREKSCSVLAVLMHLNHPHLFGFLFLYCVNASVLVLLSDRKQGISQKKAVGSTLGINWERSHQRFEGCCCKFILNPPHLLVTGFALSQVEKN